MFLVVHFGMKVVFLENPYPGTSSPRESVPYYWITSFQDMSAPGYDVSSISLVLTIPHLGKGGI